MYQAYPGHFISGITLNLLPATDVISILSYRQSRVSSWPSYRSSEWGEPGSGPGSPEPRAQPPKGSAMLPP